MVLLAVAGSAAGQTELVLEDSTSPDGWSLDGELLVWWLRSGRLPPLVTTGPETSQGILGRPGVIVAYGDEKIDTNRHLGARVVLHRWLLDEQTLGIRAGFFFLERNSRNFQAESPGTQLLARPFFNVATGDLDSEVLAGQAGGQLRTGGFDGLSKIELFGEEAALSVPVLVLEAGRLDLLTGAYCLQLRERLDLKASSRVPAAASLFGVEDRFRVHDRFYGGQLGVTGEWAAGRWFVQGRGVLALGGTERVAKTRAERVFHTPAIRQETPLGFLVQPSNLGSFRDTKADVVFEVGASVGCQVTESLRVHLGYTLIRWENTIRAGDQIDLVIDPNQTTPRPAMPFREDYFWAQGVNGGVEIRW